MIKSPDSKYTQTVVDVFLDVFEKTHPLKQMPKWFKTHTEMRDIWDGTMWRSSIIAHERDPDSSKQWFDERGFLHSIKAKTEKEMVRIHDGDPPVVLFEMTISEDGQTYEVIKDCDFNEIDSSRFIKLR